MSLKLRRFRYAATCASCGAHLPVGSPGTWDPQRRLATCAGCQPIERGEAGKSASREWLRRHERRQGQVRTSHPRVGGLILALTDDPQSTTAWAKGAQGEQMLGAALDRLRIEGIAVLHDRRIPRSRVNIDHLVISSAGVFVVDAKRYGGKVERRDRGGFFRSDYRLYVGGRDRSKLVSRMESQVKVVRQALKGSAGSAVPEVIPVLCFVDSEWGLFASPLRFGDVRVLWPKLLGKLVRDKGDLSAKAISALERQLAQALPPA
jgi:hypothetical protein